MRELCEAVREAFLQKNIDDLSILTHDILKSASDADNAIQFYYHPLGFIYATFYEFKNKESIRIHIWDKSLSNKQSGLDIHNHYYIVNSYIFCGCVYNNIYIEEGEAENEFLIFVVNYDENGERILKKTADRINLDLIRSEEHCTGSLYAIHLNEIHSGGAVSDQLTCTVVFTEKPGIPRPLVAGQGDSLDEYRFHKVQVNPETVSIVIQRVLATR